MTVPLILVNLTLTHLLRSAIAAVHQILTQIKPPISVFLAIKRVQLAQTRVIQAASHVIHLIPINKISNVYLHVRQTTLSAAFLAFKM